MALEILKITKIDVCLLGILIVSLAYQVRKNPKFSFIDEICSIGSGAVESGIKQIARRIKISGASWKSEHIGQVLAHRCAYLMA